MAPPTEVGYVVLWCADLLAQRDALVNALGLAVRYEDAEMVIFALAGTDLILQRAAGDHAERAGQVEIGFYVEDLDHLSTRAQDAGITLAADRAPLEASRRLTVLRLPAGQLVDLVGT